jgi:hypothetical protein
MKLRFYLRANANGTNRSAFDILREWPMVMERVGAAVERELGVVVKQLEGLGFIGATQRALVAMVLLSRKYQVWRAVLRAWCAGCRLQGLRQGCHTSPVVSVTHQQTHVVCF